MHNANFLDRTTVYKLCSGHHIWHCFSTPHRHRLRSPAAGRTITSAALMPPMSMFVERIFDRFAKNTFPSDIKAAEDVVTTAMTRPIFAMGTSRCNRLKSRILYTVINTASTVKATTVGYIPPPRHNSKTPVIGTNNCRTDTRRRRSAMIDATNAPIASHSFTNPNAYASAPVCAIRFNRINVVLVRKNVIAKALSTSLRSAGCVAINRNPGENDMFFSLLSATGCAGTGGSGNVSTREITNDRPLATRLKANASAPPPARITVPTAGPAARDTSPNLVYTLLNRSKPAGGTTDGIRALLVGEYKLATTEVATATPTAIQKTLLVGTTTNKAAAAKHTSADTASNTNSRFRLSHRSSQNVAKNPTMTMVRPAMALTQPTPSLPAARLTAHVITTA